MQVINRAANFQPQNVSNTLWAFASTGFEPSDTFLEMVENHLTENISESAVAPYSAQARPCFQSSIAYWILPESCLGKPTTIAFTD